MGVGRKRQGHPAGGPELSCRHPDSIRGQSDRASGGRLRIAVGRQSGCLSLERCSPSNAIERRPDRPAGTVAGTAPEPMAPADRPQDGGGDRDRPARRFGPLSSGGREGCAVGRRRGRSRVPPRPRHQWNRRDGGCGRRPVQACLVRRADLGLRRRRVRGERAGHRPGHEQGGPVNSVGLLHVRSAPDRPGRRRRVPLAHRVPPESSGLHVERPSDRPRDGNSDSSSDRR